MNDAIHRRGFTFVELLIAATMVSVLFVGLSAHLRGGLMVWRQTTEQSEILQRRRVGLDRLERDLANAIVYDARMEAYGDAPGQLPSPSFEQASMAWYAVVANGTDPARVRYITYTCEAGEDQSGLWRTIRTVGQARARTEAPGELILPDCEDMSLEYPFLSPSPTEPLIWDGVWKDAEKQLPRLVHVSILLGSGERIDRIVAVPAGVLKAQEIL